MNHFTIVEICIYGEQAERFFNLCSYHNLKLYKIRFQDDSYYFKISAADYFSLKSYARKTKVKCKIIKKSGIYYLIREFMKRKVFIFLPFLCVCILILSSNFLWNVHLDGNQSITSDMVRDFLLTEGVTYGMSLKEIPIQKLKTDFRKKYPQVTWVSMYLEGTCLRISIKENKVQNPDFYQENYYMNLVAPVSGVVDSVLLRKGTLVVKEGMTVKKGDALILGKVEIPAEDGTIKSTSYCKADGDIFLLYEYPINESLDLNYIEKEYTQNIIQKFEVVWKEKQYLVPLKKISFKTYDIMSEVIDIPLISVLSLPVSINRNRYYEYNPIEKKYSLKEAQLILDKKLSKILKTLEEKGVQIIKKNVKISTNSVHANLKGTLLLKIKCDEYETLEEDT